MQKFPSYPKKGDNFSNTLFYKCSNIAVMLLMFCSNEHRKKKPEFIYANNLVFALEFIVLFIPRPKKKKEERI